MMKFKSKRNNVYLYDNMVFKELPNRETALRESEFLEMLLSKDVAVPKVIGIDDNVLCLEYINGVPLPDFLFLQKRSCENSLPLKNGVLKNNVASSNIGTSKKSDIYKQCEQAAKGITKWLDSYYTAVDHASSSEIRGDVNGRNFLITKTGIIGVDFEKHVFGKMETDFGGLLAYVSSYSYYDPTVQNLFYEIMTDCLVKNFYVSRETLLQEKIKELSKIEKRRSILKITAEKEK